MTWSQDAAMSQDSILELLLAPAEHRFLSPHYDDVALSCGGTAARLSEGGRRLEIALVFGDHLDPDASLTPFAESLHEEWGLDAAQVIAGRRAEEAAAGAILGARHRFLPFKDCIYRGNHYVNEELLFGTPAADESGLPGEIVAHLGLVGSGRGSTRVYAPLGIGRHVDHQHAFAAGVLLARDGWVVWFYEDQPYALRGGALADWLAAVDEAFEPAATVDVRATWSRKMDAIMAYSSQVAAIFGEFGFGESRAEIDALLARHAEQVGAGIRAERFWRLANRVERDLSKDAGNGR